MKSEEFIKTKIDELQKELENLPRQPINVQTLCGSIYYYTDKELVQTAIDILNWVLEDGEDVENDKL